MNIPYHKLSSRHLFNVAHAMGAVSTVLTYIGTDSLWLALAVACLFLTLHTLYMGAAWYIAEQQQGTEDVPLDHRKVVAPEPRHTQGDRYAYGATSPDDRRLWNHRPDGFTRPQVLFCITGILGAHALLVVGYVIICAVFGAQEPKW